MHLDAGLHDITGLAYGRSGLLYAVDVAWADPSMGGLYRLDMEIRDGRQAVKPVKLLALDRPTGIVVLSDRLAYVSTLGKGQKNEGDAARKFGQLIKIEGEF